MSPPSEGRRYQVYTDGGASPNPGTGGWGVVIVDPAGNQSELSGGAPETTNNRMELTAAIEAMNALPAGAAVDLYTDSRYVRQGITQWVQRWMRQGWQRRSTSGKSSPVKNADLWRRLVDLEQCHQVAWHWVKGHAGDRFNERADELASAEITSQRRHTPVAPLSGPLAVEVEADAGSVDVEATIKVACERGRGAWAIHLRRPGSRETAEILTQAHQGTTANRLELEAALALLGRVDAKLTVAFRSGDYLRRGAGEWLQGWKQRGWKTGSGEPVKNSDLWRAIDHEIALRRVLFYPLERDGAVEKELARRARAARDGRAS